MSFCKFSDQSAIMDVTPVENLFLMEYMPTAPEGFVRVYLYARMLCVHPELAGDMADMASALHLDEDTVFNAFAYWEQQGLAVRISDRPPVFALTPVRTGAAPAADMDRDYYRFRDYNATLQDIFGADHLLHAKQFDQAHDWVTVFGLETDAAIRLVVHEYKTGRGKSPESVFKRVHEKVIDLADRGVRTAADMERLLAGEDEVARVSGIVLRRLGIGRKATPDELECVRRWLIEWKLDEKTLIDACAETVKGRSPSIGYLDSILKNRREGGGEFNDLRKVLRELGVSSIPTPDQKREFARLLEKGFEAETVRIAAVRCARKRSHSFQDLLGMLESWEAAGIRTKAQAEAYVKEMQQLASEARMLLEKAGLDKNPTRSDLEYCRTWNSLYSPALIECAAEFARGTERPMAYMDKLLTSWAAAGITTEQAAREEHRSRPAQSGKMSAKQSKFDYEQRSYKPEDFGEDYFFDPLKDFPAQGKEENQ